MRTLQGAFLKIPEVWQISAVDYRPATLPRLVEAGDRHAPVAPSVLLLSALKV